MKHIRLLAVAVFSALLFMSFTVTAREWWENVYIGADAQVRRMDFKGGFGDNLFQHHAPQGNLYVGLKFNNYIGVELGFESTTTRTRISTLTTGDLAAGTPIRLDTSPAVFKSKAKIKGPHAELVGFYSPRENSPVQLFGSVGVSIIKGTFERRTLQTSNMPQSMVRTLSDHKTVLRLTGGLQYMITENWGTRATVGWINTGKMVIVANDGIPGACLPEVKPKNSTVYGLGMLWGF